MKLLLLGVMLASFGCSVNVKQTDPVEPTPPVVQDEDVVQPTPDPVVKPPPTQLSREQRMCYAWDDLGCSEARITPEGKTCLEVIQNASTIGIDLTKDLECVENAATCDAARECNN